MTPPRALRAARALRAVRGLRALRVAAVLPWVLCVPAAAAVPALALHDRSATGADAAGPAAAAAARTAVVDVLSYDYRTIRADIRAAARRCTGTFAEQYAASADRLAAQARQTHAVVRATAGPPGVVAADPGRVVVLVFVDQSSVRRPPGAARPTTQLVESRVLATMSDVGGRWLVSRLDIE